VDFRFGADSNASVVLKEEAYRRLFNQWRYNNERYFNEAVT
jgi:hypothetical protein